PAKAKDELPSFPGLPSKEKLEEPKPLPPMNVSPVQGIAPPVIDVKPPVAPDAPKPVQAEPKPVIDNLPPEFKPNVNAPRVGTAPMPAIAEQVAKLKNCPWSLQIDMVDGQTVVVATVSRKYEFKIVCQSLDLQTGKGTLKASGKVQITGDMMTASCDQLSIPLMEDRLQLEGGAQVSIQKISTVSTERAGRFELKSDRLELRVADVSSEKAVQTSSAIVPALDAIQLVGNPPIAANENGKKWTSYGTLRRVEAKIHPGNEPAVW